MNQSTGSATDTERGPEGPQTPRGSGWQAVLLTYGTAVGAFVLGTVIAVALVTVWNAEYGEPGAVTLLAISLVSLQGIAFPVTAYVYLRLRDLDWSFVPLAVPDLNDVKWIVVGYVSAFVILFVANIVVRATGIQTASNEAANTAIQNPGIIPVVIVLQFLLVGPGEELLFRGIIQGTLRRYFSVWPAIVLASLAFAPAHILALTGGLPAAAASIAILFFPSLVFGYAYERSRNFFVPAFTHASYNATLFGLIYVSSQLQPSGSSVLGVAQLLDAVHLLGV